MRALQLLLVCGLLATVSLLSGPDLCAQDDRSVQYYVSNDLGMALEKIGWYRLEEFPYILMVESAGPRETRTLLHQGEELQRWEYEDGEQRFYRDSVLEQVLRYDARDRLIEEQLYSDGTLSRRTVYHYTRDVLERSETFGPEGALLYRDFYRLSPYGQLRRVVREDPRADQRFALDDGSRGVAEERYGNNRERRINRYDSQGRLVERERWYEGQLVERERIEYNGDGGKRSVSTLEDLALERITLRSYDQQGRVVRIEVSEKGEPVERTVHRRDEEGRIVETTTRGSRGIENWRFEYDQEGRLAREEYRLRGSLEKIILYSRDGEEMLRVEELFREGRLFMRVHYRSEQKVREEFLSDGEVVRVREYQ
jgi:YD repeat-containing protein